MRGIGCSVFLGLLFFAVGTVHGDTIRLKDGHVYSGTIVFENEVFVRIDTLTGEDGKIKEFLKDNVVFLERGPSNVPARAGS